MFYKKESIDEILTCLACKLVYQDPRVLPCGHTICHDCIQRHQDSESQFECLECLVRHTVPSTGFPVNAFISKIVQVQAGPVSQTDEVRTLRNKLKRTREKMLEVRTITERHKDTIKEYCHGLRMQIQLKVETRVHEIQTHGSNLIEQVDDYENECAKASQCSTPPSDQLESTLSAIQNRVDESDRDLGEFDVSDWKIKSMMTDADNDLIEMSTQQWLVNSNKFNNRQLVFDNYLAYPLRPEIVGTLRYKSRELNVDNFRRLDTKFLFKMDDHIFGKAPNKIICFNNANSVLKVAVVRSEASPVELKDVTNSRVRDYSVVDCGDELAVVISFKDSDQSMQPKKLKLFGEELIIKSKTVYTLLKVNYELGYKESRQFKFPAYKLLASNSTYLFGLENNKKIFFHAEDLIAESFFWNYSKSKFYSYHDNQIIDVKANDSCLFITVPATSNMIGLGLQVVDIKTKVILKEIELEGWTHAQLRLVSHNYLAVFHKTKSILRLYDQSSELEHLGDFHVKVPCDCLISSDDSQKLCFLYYSGGKIYHDNIIP